MDKNFIEFQAKKSFSEEDLLFILTICNELLVAPTMAYITQAKEVKE